MLKWPVSTTSLLDTHRRIRAAGPLVSVVAAHRRRNARTTVAMWAADQRPFVCPIATLPVANWAGRAQVADRAWRARGGTDRVVLFLDDALYARWTTARAFAEAHPRVDVVVISPVHEVIEALLDTHANPEFVTQLMQGLVPVEEKDGQMIQRVAEDPRLRPFVRSPYEGLMYFLLEARPETRGRFQANRRIAGYSGKRYEVDLVEFDRRLVVEIDGPQHESPDQEKLDELKEKDLGAVGFAFLRMTHADVARNPVGAWETVLQNSEHRKRNRKTS